MKTRMGLVFVAGLMVHLLLAGSAGAEEPKATQGAEARSFLHFGNMGGVLPTLDADDLPDQHAPGPRLMAKYCAQCHNLPAPGMHTVKEWSKIYWVMYWRMVQMKKNDSTFKAPDYNEGKIMFAYLTQYAMKAMRFGDVDVSNPEGRVFQRVCMQCHQLPSPTQYSKRDWRSIVKRMQGHMASMGKHIPRPDDITKIIHYLQSESLD